MRISDWSSDVCSSDLTQCVLWRPQIYASVVVVPPSVGATRRPTVMVTVAPSGAVEFADGLCAVTRPSSLGSAVSSSETVTRSEEHTSELQSLMRTSASLLLFETKSNKRREQKKTRTST